MQPGLVLLAAAVASLPFIYLAFRSARRRWLVQGIPTCKTTGIFMGLVEVKGQAEAAQPLSSRLAGQECVHYEWSAEEHWSRTVTETYRDDKGNLQTRTRHESGWTTVASGTQTIPFYVRDDSGVVLVRPQGAKIESQTWFRETCGPAAPLYYGAGPANAISDSDHERRFTEWGVPHHAELYVIGTARERHDVVAPEIAADKTAPLFLISTRSEEAVSGGMWWGLTGWTIAGLAAALGVAFFLTRAPEMPLERQLPLLAAAAGVFAGLFAIVWVWMVFNALVDIRNRVRRAWSLVDIQLQRRSDLIPALVSVVTASRDYERELQTELAELRSQAAAGRGGSQAAAGAGSGLHGAVPVVRLIAEKYPELTADKNFENLQRNLIETEQRIALARTFFNDSATHFNTLLETVPDRWIAALGGLRPENLFQAVNFERAPVSVAPLNLRKDADGNRG